MPTLVEPPKIVRPRAGKRGSKYVNDDLLKEVAALCTEGWCGDIIEPVNTLVKARIAASAWKTRLMEYMDKDRDAFAVRVYTTGPDQWTFAIALKKGA